MLWGKYIYFYRKIFLSLHQSLQREGAWTKAQWEDREGGCSQVSCGVGFKGGKWWCSAYQEPPTQCFSHITFWKLGDKFKSILLSSSQKWLYKYWYNYRLGKNTVVTISCKKQERLPLRRVAVETKVQRILFLFPVNIDWILIIYILSHDHNHKT